MKNCDRVSSGHPTVFLFEFHKIREFMLACLRSLDVRDDIANEVANSLATSSLRGIDSHGVRLFAYYVRALRGGRINGNPRLEFVATSPSAGVFKADHTFGHAAAVFAIRKAKEMAEATGVGAVAVAESTHCGALSYIAQQPAKEDYIGLAATHANSLLRTPGSKRPFFGLNPLAIAIPCTDEEPFSFDSTPAFLNWNKLLSLREAKRDLPPNCAANVEGEITRDPSEATQLLPLGDYKGFGLAMVVDVLCGLLTGMPSGRDIVDMYNSEISQKRRLGHFVAVAKIAAFVDPATFKDRMQALMDTVRREPRASGAASISVAGDPEKRALEQRKTSGIPISGVELRALKGVAIACEVALPNHCDFQ